MLSPAAVTQSTDSHRSLATQPHEAFPIPEERPSGVRFCRAPRPTSSKSVRTELRASQVDAVARREIEWFFTSDAEGPDADDARALLEARFRALDRAHIETLALRYDPLACPESLEPYCGDGTFALVLRVAFAGHWRPHGRACHWLEREATRQLAAAVTQHGPRVLAHVVRSAEWDFTTALAAYVDLRGRVPSALPVSR